MVGKELAHFGGESAAEEKLAEAEPVGRRRREEGLSVGFAPQRDQRLAIYLPLPHTLGRKLVPLEHGQHLIHVPSMHTDITSTRRPARAHRIPIAVVYCGM